MLQQWSGINVIFNYAEEVYRNAGYGVSDVMFNIVITGTINLVFTLVALGLVDRFGRRPLMLFGCAGIGLSHLLIGIAYLAHTWRHMAAHLYAGSDRMFCHVARTRYLGVDLGDLSQPHPRGGCFHRSFGALDCFVHFDVLIPSDSASLWLGRDILVIRRNLLCWVYLYLVARSGDKRENTRRD